MVVLATQWPATSVLPGPHPKRTCVIMRAEAKALHGGGYHFSFFPKVQQSNPGAVLTPEPRGANQWPCFPCIGVVKTRQTERGRALRQLASMIARDRGATTG